MWLMAVAVVGQASGLPAVHTGVGGGCGVVSPPTVLNMLLSVETTLKWHTEVELGPPAFTLESWHEGHITIGITVTIHSSRQEALQFTHYSFRWQHRWVCRGRGGYPFSMYEPKQRVLHWWGGMPSSVYKAKHRICFTAGSRSLLTALDRMLLVSGKCTLWFPLFQGLPSLVLHHPFPGE